MASRGRIGAFGLGTLAALLAAAGSIAEEPWTALEPGLDLGVFRPASRTDADAVVVRVLRIDPTRFRLRLLNASGSGEGAPRTAKEWCARHGFAAAINASMYQEDLRTSVSLMRTKGHVNNPRLSKDMTVLAFDRLDPGVPEVQIIDRECQDFDALRSRYGTLVQSVRMVSCARRNVWTPQARRASVAAVGVDDRGRVLFIHSATPLPTHDLIDLLLDLPIGVARAMYAEGGSESQMFVRAGGKEHEFVGGFRSGPDAGASSGRATPVPNVIAAERIVP